MSAIRREVHRDCRKCGRPVVWIYDDDGASAVFQREAGVLTRHVCPQPQRGGSHRATAEVPRSERP